MGGKGVPGFFLPAGLIGVTDAPKWRLIGVSAHLGPQFLVPTPGPLSNTGLEDANLSAFRKVGSARNRTVRIFTTLRGHNAWLERNHHISLICSWVKELYIVKVFEDLDKHFINILAANIKHT